MLPLEQGSGLVRALLDVFQLGLQSFVNSRNWIAVAHPNRVFLICLVGFSFFLSFLHNMESGGRKSRSTP